MPRDLTLLVCESFRREAEVILQTPGFAGVRLATLPAICDPTPPQRADLAREVAARVEEHGACCLVGGGCLQDVELAPELDRSLVVVRGETCFHLLANPGLVGRWMQEGAHLVTPGWLAHWQEALARWGLDRETAGALFRESSKRLLLLDTGVDPAAGGRLQELAAHLELPSSAVPVGLDHYRLVLHEAVQQAHAAIPGFGDVGALRLRNADAAAVLDFVMRLSGARDEPEIVGRLLDLTSSLLAPDRLQYCAVDDDTIGPLRVFPPGAAPSADLEEEMRAFRGDARLSSSGRGILFRVADEHETFGVAAADGLAFPGYGERYVKLARNLARAAAVIVGSARALARAARAEAEQRRAREAVERGLTEALESVRTLRGLLPICASCKKIRDPDGKWTRLEDYVSARSEAVFTHGVCPECYAKLYPELGRD